MSNKRRCGVKIIKDLSTKKALEKRYPGIKFVGFEDNWLEFEKPPVKEK